jgi:hypothetical protein
MAANTTDDDVDPSAARESKDDDPASEMAALRERLMRALAETENTSVRVNGARRTPGNTRSPALPASCCRSSTICVAPSALPRRTRMPEREMD